MRNIGLIIQEKRKTLNMSQAELANKIGITKSYMSKLESGLKTINLKRLASIGEVLEIDIFEYLNSENEIFLKWEEVIHMFEDIEITPNDVILLKEFLKQVKSSK